MSVAEHEQKGAWGGGVSPRPWQWSEGTLADRPKDRLGMRRLSRGSMPQDPESNLALGKFVENGCSNRGVRPRIPNPGIVVTVVVFVVDPVWSRGAPQHPQFHVLQGQWGGMLTSCHRCTRITSGES